MQSIKPFLIFIIIVFSKTLFAQDFSDSWQGHFSYLDIKDISQGTTKIFGAAENAIFIYDKELNDIEKITTINGLSGETISNINYVEDKGLLLVGYVNGLMQIYIESSGDFLTVVDIINKPTIPPVNKRINHFEVYNNTAYISTDYGISLYDIDNFEFGDSYFFGIGGTQIKTKQLTILNDTIYAATGSGIYTADVNNPNLIDFNQWTKIGSTNWVGVISVQERVFIAGLNRRVYELIGTSTPQKAAFAHLIKDFRVENDLIVITTQKEAYAYSVEDFNEEVFVETSDNFIVDFTSAIVSSESEIYVGTNGITNIGKPGFGILKASFSNPTEFEEIHPSSPLLNKFFRIETQAGRIWATHGGQSITYNFNGGERRTGISRFKDSEWNNIKYDSLNTTFNNPFYLSQLSINPFNSDEAYISSYFSGLIKVNNNELEIFDQNNSTIVPFAGPFHLALANNFDKDGALWVMNGRVDLAVNKFADGAWTSFSLGDIIQAPTSNLGFSSVVFQGEDNIFIGSHNYGIIGFKKNGGNPIVINIDGDERNIPSPSVRTTAVDKQGQVWIGTGKGLRVVYNTEEFFSNPDFAPSEIIVLDDGTPRELLFQQFITDIEVDGANNKWIATLDTGVYYFSSDGQETIYHFTKDNSPLPSNDVLDVALDEVNGLVYMATDKGMVSFNSQTSIPETNLADAYVFPNPVRPNFNINIDKIKIKGLSGNINVKITDIEGNLVTEAESRTNKRFSGSNLEIDGGTGLWNGKNLAGRTVATGVYLVLISDLDSFETKTLKLMVVR